MNLIELERALRQLRLGGIAAVLETRLHQAQAEAMAPIDLISCLVIPTAFSLIAIKQFTACNRSEASEKRSIWVSRCFWTAHVLTEGGTPETALFTEYRCARMLRRQRSRCWLSRTNSEPK